MLWHFRQKHHLLLLLIAYLLLGIGYSLTVPAGEGVDEIPHFDYVRYIKEGHGLPVQSFEPNQSPVYMGHHPPLYYLLGGLVTAWTDTSDFSSAFVPNPHFVWRENYGGNGWNVYLHFGQDNFPYRGAVLSLHVMRLLTVLMGTIAVWAIYRIARRVTRRADLSFAAAAITAFNPSFLFMTSTVHHDSLMAMIGALSLLWAVEALHRQPTWKGYVLAGLLLSAGVLTKLSGLSLVAVFGLVIAWISWQQRSWRRFLTASAIVYGLAMILAGWWYVRNQVLYGDPLAWQLFLSSQRHMVRTGLYGWTELGDFMGQIQRTYWGAFGYMHITLPEWVYNSFWAVAGLSGAGAAVALIRHRCRAALRETRTMMWLSLCAAWVLWFASFVRFSMATVGAGHARYLFPVSATLSTLMVVGLSQLAPRRWNRIPALALSGILLVYAALVPWAVIQPLYPAPQLANAADLNTLTPADIDFEGALRLKGYRIDSSNVQAGRDLQVNLYWQAAGVDRPDLFTEISLTDADGNLIGRSRRWPAENGTSIQVWEPVDVYADSRTLRVADAAPTGEARLRLRVKQGRDGPNVTASQAGKPLGDQVTLIAFQIQTASSTAP
jgi:hypothetical protein